MSQSIDMSAVTEATLNGSTVEKINLNGSEVWTKPSSCISKTASSPHLINLPSTFLNGGASIPIGSSSNTYQTNVDFNLGGIYCGTNYRVEFPAYTLFVFVGGYCYAKVKFYKNGQLVHTSPQFDVTISMYSVPPSIDHSATLPAGGVDKIVLCVYNGSTVDSYWLCTMASRAGTVKLWG